MSAERDDAEIRAQYQRLRREDEGVGRSLDAFRQAVRARPRRPQAAGRGHRRQLRQRLAAAALGLALAVGLGALRWLRPRPAPPSDEAAIARLAHWRAPTDALLQAPGDRLLRGVPRLGESSIDGNFHGGKESE